MLESVVGRIVAGGRAQVGDQRSLQRRQLASLAPGSMLAMTLLLPSELVEPGERARYQAVQAAARASGTPFLSFFSPPEMLALARDAGFRDAQYVSATVLNQRYFADRTDGLQTSNGEELLVATA